MIETPRLLLRPFRLEDWEAFHQLLSDPLVMQYEPYPPFTLMQSRDETLRRAGNRGYMAVCLQDGTLIGSISLLHRGQDCWELSLLFGRDWWGMGYGQESAVAALEWAFKQRGAHRISARCHPDNLRCCQLLERLGMRREGCFRQNLCFSVTPDGEPEWQDTLYYAILADEWPPV